MSRDSTPSRPRSSAIWVFGSHSAWAGPLLIEDYRRAVIEAGLELERFEPRGSQMARHAAEGTTSPDPLAAETVAAAGGEAIELVRSVDIVARKRSY